MTQRVIKFRAWDDDLKIMLNWEDMRYCVNPDSRFFISQFTGLHDKNGVEIYEGDILSNSMAYPMVSSVKWNNDKALFNAISKHRTSWLFSANALFEVIGNIYENPELLESK